VSAHEACALLVSASLLFPLQSLWAQSPGGGDLERGIALYWSGQYQETIELLSPLCSSESREDASGECYKYVAFSHVALGDNEKAQQAFSSLLSLDLEYELDESLVSPKILDQFHISRKKLLDALFERGKAAYFGKDYDKAKELMGRILKLDADHALAKEYVQLANEQAALEEKAASLAKVEESEAPIAKTEEQSDPDRVYHLTGRMTRPELVTKVQPRYPIGERRARREGTVVVTAIIGKDGTVRDAKVIRSVSPGLDSAAVEAVLQWRYRPAKLEGNEIAVYTVVTLSFTLGS
jgi:TonB family protein